MKFGHNLPRNQVPEWAASYIQYKALKKLIKAVAHDAQDGRTADLAGTLAVDSLDVSLTSAQSFHFPLTET
jgi:glycerophosphodiester phosphodiesterase